MLAIAPSAHPQPRPGCVGLVSCDAHATAGSCSSSPYLGPLAAEPQQQQQQPMAAAALQLPASALPMGLASAAASGGLLGLSPLAPFLRQVAATQAHSGSHDSQCSHSSAHALPEPQQQPQQQLGAASTPPTVTQQQLGGSSGGRGASPLPLAAEQPDATSPAPKLAPCAPPPPHSAKSWQYELVTCPFLFKPCAACSGAHSGREVLITYFDPDEPGRGFCTYCPERASRPRLLQIRRSTYHEVVKAQDVCRIADVTGVQHYVINGAKVVFLRPRPQPRPPKGVVAPARCIVDGRQLMDSHSSYCSLRCKLETEDALFAAHYPSGLEEMEAVAAAAAAEAAGDGCGGLAGALHRQGGHEGRRVVVPSHKRAAAGSQQPAHAPGAAGRAHVDAEPSSEEGDAEARGPRAKRPRHLPSKFDGSVILGDGYSAAVAGGSSAGSHQHQHPGQPHRASHSGGGHHAHAHGRKGARSGAHGSSQLGLGAPCGARDADSHSDQAPHRGALLPAGLELTAAHLLAAAVPHDQEASGGSRQRRGSSPSGSDDSARSSTCTRWQHKRKHAPCRAPMQ